MDVEVLMNKKKNAAAAYIRSECCRTSSPETLRMLLDTLLDPLKKIDSFDTIDWIKWLMAGGCSPEEFTANVRKYDNATTCGLVWTANFVAYRCRTCGISPCMSLCAECFQRGNHKGHDFNMFRSQAGGACDCGDMNVMKESGFCYLHGPHSQNPNLCTDGSNIAPPDLLCVVSQMMPRLILRLIQHMRDNSNSLSGFLGGVQEADSFITMLHDMSGMGAAMRQVMTHALTNPQIYKNLTDITEIGSTMSPQYYEYMSNSKSSYEQALRSLPNPKPPEEYKDIPALQQDLIHRTFLEEFVFWTAKFEFPQKIVCLLLNLLPDEDYKEAFTRAFVLHYGRISQLLVQSTDPDMLSNRVVHVSVQLFSNEKLALRMAEQMGLLHVMVISLTYMMSKITIPSTLSSGRTGSSNSHYVVDCGNQCMKDHCYWPLVSDLNNILSHRPVALRFLEDDGLLKMWFSFLSLFQGMNANQREIHQHVEYEPTTYYAAFSTELEASASPMWALVSHLRDASTAHLTKNLIRHCKEELKIWFGKIEFNGHDLDEDQVSFHLPLHRYFSVFLYQAVRNQGLSLQELLPSPKELRAIIQHPLRVQTGFYEIISGLWVRNGLQIKGQAMTYVQCHFCNSMVDADLFLLQVAMMNLPYGEFLSTVLQRFSIMESLSISNSVTNPSLEADHEVLMMENCLIFLASLASIRTAIGVSDSDLVTLEMVTLLCMADKTHSQLMELMPERCGNSSQSRDFEAVLSNVADYRAPNFESSGNMLQGMYVPKPFVWETLYDPIYILLRAVHRRDFQTSLDRFADYAKQAGQFKGNGTPWTPFRIPQVAEAPYTDPRFVLESRVFHGLLFVIFFKAFNTSQWSDQLLSLAVYLLELALSVTDPIGHNVMSSRLESNAQKMERYDMNFSTWFTTDCLLVNLRTEIDDILVKPNADDAIPGSDSSDENSVDDVMEVEAYEVEVEMFDEGYDEAVMVNQAAFVPHQPGNLAIMPSAEQARAALEEDVNALLEIQERLRDAEENLRRRTMQMMVASPKPVVSVHKKEIGRSSTSGGMSEVEVGVNESIISLLLKLHSKLSSAPDSYTPYWDTPAAQIIITDTMSGVQNGLDVGTIHRDEYSTFYSPLFYTQLYDAMSKQGIHVSRVGDGRFFIGNILDRIAAKDNSCREYILELKNRLWPKEAENDEERLRREAKEDAERKKKASERRRQATEEMQRNQQAFMDKMKREFEPGTNPFEEAAGEEEDEENRHIKPLEYHCVICNLTGPSTPNNPIGLVILLQASSVLGHRTKRDSRPNTLPTNDEEKLSLLTTETMSIVNEIRLQEMTLNFDDDSWLMAMSAGWEGGVHVQTCGHHLHHECLKDYHSSLKTQQRQHNISIERGEYFCPLCRQLANSFLPLSSEFGVRKSALVKDRKGSAEPMTPETTSPEIPPSPEANVALEVLKLLKEYPLPTDHSKMVDAMAKTMEEMTNATSLKYRKIGSTTNTKSILLFVNSIARTNLELELVLRGGNLVSIPTDPQPSTSCASPMVSSTLPKRSCIVPLLHVLGVHYKILSTDQCLPTTWERMLGVRFLPETTVMTPDREVPMLLRDPSSTLLHLLMNLPMHVDSAYFTSMVQALYNHVYIQALCIVSTRLRYKERAEWKAKKSLYPISSEPMSKYYKDINHLAFLLGTVISYLEKSRLYLPDADYGDMDCSMSNSSPTTSRSTSQTQVGRSESFETNDDEIENQLERLLLPFVRIASLLRHHLYDQDLPFITTIDEEFSLLGQFLNLGLSEVNKTKYARIHDGIKAHHFLYWISPAPLTSIWTWCEDLSHFVGRSLFTARSLLASQNINWGQPRLLELPHAYDNVFQYYHRRQCPKCNLIPKDPSVCLLCGTMVCLRDGCCKTQTVCEATQHAVNCGAGTAIFLSVNSSTIVVIRGKRACLWGSVYLDSFGEEDRELKRGKPLFLSKERYALLQKQWITHRFDHSPRKWIFHRDAL